MDACRFHRNPHGIFFILAFILCWTLVLPATGAPVISSVTPSEAGGAANITLTVCGSGFEPRAEIVLTPVNITPVLKGSIPDGSSEAFLIRPTTLIISGDYAYVTGPENHLDIINISDPAHPVHTTRMITRTNGIDMAIGGPYAYVIGGNALDIIDISNPAKPVSAGFISSDTSDSILHAAYGISVSQNHAYIVSILTNTIEVFDITDRQKPVFRSRIRSGDFGARFANPNSIHVAGNRAYITSSDRNAIEILDIANPVMPDHLGYLMNGTGGAHLVSPFHTITQGKYAFVANYQDNSIEILDVSDPHNPTHVTTLMIAAPTAGNSDPYGMKISGNYLFVGTENGLEIIDITNPVHPSLKYSRDPSPYFRGPRAAFDIAEHYAYVIHTQVPSGIDYGGDPDTKNTLEIFDIGFILATNVTISGQDEASCTIGLPQKPVSGLYNVVITNPDGQFGVLEGGFEIPESDDAKPGPDMPKENLPKTTPTAGSLPFFPIAGILIIGIIFRKLTRE